MDAIRSELATGLPTNNVYHVQKGMETINALNKWLAANPTASYGDRLVAQSPLDELMAVRPAMETALATGGYR